MSNMQELLDFNKKFVEGKRYEPLETTKYPNKKVAILSCMDTRLTELLPASMNLKNGDVQIIKNAGAVISHPFGSIMRSLLIAVYQLNVEEIMVIAHDDCGMERLDASSFIQKMRDRGIPDSKIDMIKYCGIDLAKWLKGFENVRESVLETVHTIRNHPLMPDNIQVQGFVMNSRTGELSPICEEA